MQPPSIVFLFLFVIKYFLGNINRSVFALLKGSSHIFTNDANTEQLHTSQKKYQHDDRCVTGDINTCNDFFQYNSDEIYQCRHRSETSQQGSGPQRLGGISNNAVDRIVEQLSEIPLADTRDPFTCCVRNKAGIVADPGKNAFREAMVFSNFDDTVCNAPAEGPEVTGIRF